MTRRVVICAEVWSDNLGDRVIAECTRNLIESVSPGTTVSLLDLCARPQPKAGQAPVTQARAAWRALAGVATSMRTIRLLMNVLSWGLRNCWKVRIFAARHSLVRTWFS